jgi:hypothetical protein
MKHEFSRGDVGREKARKRRRALRWLLAGLLAPGCVLDSDDLCGPNQVIWGDDDELCVCAEGTAYTPTGCVPCGENELGTAAGCVCATGYARATAADACVLCGEHAVASPSGCTCESGFGRSSPLEPCAELLVAGAGADCASDAECVNPAYPHCQLRASGSGYCTNTGCATDTECADDFRCVTSSSPAVCKLPPEGEGRPCMTPGDCAGSEATFCDSFMTFSCLVQNCSLDPNDCFPGTECCDVGFGLPPICIPTGACQT